MIVYSQSVKGGDGKSVVCRFVADHFIRKGKEEGKRLLLADTDNGNCDVARSYTNKDETGKDCDVLAVDSSKEAGFGEVLNAIYEAGKAGRDVVVNTGARNAEEMKNFGPALLDLCSDLKLDLVTLWTIDTDTVCLEQLANYLETMGKGSRTVIVRNLGMTDGDESRFAFVDDTNIGKAVPSVTFPKLSNSVTDLLKSPSCKAVHEVLDSLNMGVRYMVRGQIEAGRQAVAEALKVAKKVK